MYLGLSEVTFIEPEGVLTSGVAFVRGSIVLQTLVLHSDDYVGGPLLITQFDS